MQLLLESNITYYINVIHNIFMIEDSHMSERCLRGLLKNVESFVLDNIC